VPTSFEGQIGVSIACFSSFTFSYLDRARVLYKSLRKWHPSWTLIALISDEVPPGVDFDPAREPFDQIVYVNELGIDRLESWLFKHDVIETCTAVKGPFLLQLCSSGYEKIFYLDPDTVVFNTLSNLEVLLDHHDILLTPHQLIPEEDPIAIVDNEITSLATGIYNLGFLAISTKVEARRFAKWWSDRLLLFCHDDIPRGVFVDQRWCDHVPAFFDNVHIVKDPGYNVASWNVGQRKVRIDANGTILVNNVPLRFWHFTKLGPVGDTMTRKHAGSNFQVYELWNWYKSQVADASLAQLPPKYWAYSTFTDGNPILRKHRLLYRARQDLQDAFSNPFLSGPGTLQEWLEANSQEWN
jgi:hypothetical protein